MLEGDGGMSDTRRIAKNTLMLYFRQILIMLVSLYTVRVVLNVLGAEDYGIYNVVAGVVTMFGFLSGAMATASQRYFSYDLGKGNVEHIKTTFSVTFQIYVLLALVIVILAESVGVWFVNHRLVIPVERLTAANWIFQAAIVSFLLTLITTPYMACIISHENMNVYAYVSIVEVALKLGIVFLLRVLPYDKLIVYGALLALVALVNTSIYRFYCRRHYAECKARFVKDRALFKEIISYSGWNLFGNVATVCKVQGVTFLLNIFFGPVVNAAQGIASQVRNAAVTFSSNFMQAVRPQIVKSYAAEEFFGMWRTLFWGCKISFFLILMIAVALFSNISYVLSLWVKNVPEHTSTFVRLLLLDSLVESISQPMAQANQATGKIALYQVFMGIMQFLNLPLSYIFLRLDFSANAVYVVAVFCSAGLVLFRTIFLWRIPEFNFIAIVRNVFLPCGLCAAILFTFDFFVKLGNGTFLMFCMDVFAKISVSAILIFFIGLSKGERKSIVSIVLRKIKGVWKK